MNRHFLIAVLLILATLFVFLQVRSFDFINYDDQDYIVNNPMVSQGLSSEGITWAFTAEKSATWQPLTWISLMSDVRDGQIVPGTFHVTNLVLHLFNVLLLYALLFVMTRAPWPSALAAALFAIHPLHVESVAWVTERKDVLSTFWGLLSLLAYVRFARTRARLFQFLAALSMALGLMAKPMLVTWPLVMLLLDWWPLQRIAKLPLLTYPPRSLTTLIVEKIPFFALTFVSSWIAFRVQSGAAAVADFDSLSLVDRLSNALVAYVRYLGKTFWPRDFSIIYPHPNMSGGTPWATWQVGGAILLLLTITALVVVFRRHRFAAMGWLWFLGTLVPVIGLVQIGTHAMADRFTYVPLIGLFIIVAWSLKMLHEAIRKRNDGPDWLVPAMAVILVLAVLLPGRSLTAKWRDSATLYEYSLESGPGSPKLHYNLGLAYSGSGRREEAAIQYRHAIRLQPQHSRAWNNLGRTLGLLGRFDESEKVFQEALRLQPELVLARINYAVMLEKAGRADDAITQRMEALKQDPSNPINCNHIGVLLGQQGKFTEAITHFKRALQLKPGWQMAAKNLQSAQKAVEQGLGKK
ncbi:MAG: tetratricopeptide repeat protein [Gemmatimonadales bacterium]|nr:tetratricopeptide repeat protein [Gemmatimonadales bacterium]